MHIHPSVAIPLLAATLLAAGCASPPASPQVSTSSSAAPASSMGSQDPADAERLGLVGAWFLAEGRCLERYEFAKNGVFYSTSGIERLKGRYLAEDLKGEPPVLRVTRKIEESNGKEDCGGHTQAKANQTHVRYVLMAADRASMRVCASQDGKGCFGPLTRKLPPTPWLTYGGRVQAVFKPFIHYPKELLEAPALRSNPSTEVEVRSQPDGKILGFKMLTSSGTKSWDDTVLGAMKQVDVLPADYQGKVPPVLIIGFRPHP